MAPKSGEPLMPVAALPLALGLGGSLLGAAGSSGKQASQNATSTNTSSGTQTVTPNEPGYFSFGRQQLLPALFGALGQAQQPVYGAATKASVLNDLNGLAADTLGKLRSTAGSRGQLRSGYLERAGLGVEQNRLGQLSSFFAGLPQQERQTQLQNIMGILSPAFGFFGNAPIGQTTVSNTSSKGNQDQSLSGPGFRRSLASGLGGLAGDLFGNWVTNNNPFGGSGGSGSSSPSSLSQQALKLPIWMN